MALLFVSPFLYSLYKQAYPEQAKAARNEDMFNETFNGNMSEEVNITDNLFSEDKDEELILPDFESENLNIDSILDKDDDYDASQTQSGKSNEDL